MLIVLQSECNRADYQIELLDWYNDVWKDIDSKYANEIVRVYEKNGDIHICLPNKDVLYSISRTDGCKYTSEDIMFLLES